MELNTEIVNRNRTSLPRARSSNDQLDRLSPILDVVNLGRFVVHKDDQSSSSSSEYVDMRNNNVIKQTEIQQI